MKQNICVFQGTSGIDCDHPDRDGKCQGKCDDFLEDVSDLLVAEEGERDI